MRLLTYLSPKMPHDYVQYVLFVRRMQNNFQKFNKTQTLCKKVSGVHPVESQFEPHLKVLATKLFHFFSGYASEFNYWQFNAR